MEREQERMFEHIFLNMPDGDKKDQLLKEMRDEMDNDKFSAPPELTKEQKEAVTEYGIS